MVRAGDVAYKALGPLDLPRDTMADTFRESAWVSPRLWVNRFDMMARYPELRDEIDALPSKFETESERPRVVDRASWNMTSGGEDSDEIPLYQWMHRKSDALPDGRMILFLSPEVAVYDGPLPYREIPLYRMAAREVDGGTTGYSALYDCLAPQEAINAVVSTVVSNQASFGVQNIWVPVGSNLSWKSLRGGLNLIEGGTRPPQGLNLLATKEETFRLFELLRGAVERYSGINSTVRGNPEASLKSGAALALVYAQTIQFIALTQKAYIKAAERVGTGTLHDYQDFGSAKRTVAIAGEANRPYSVEFSSEDIREIERVTVKMANPLTGTIAGRYNLAEMMLQGGMIDDPKQLMEVLTSGRLEPVFEAPIRERMLIRSENERLSKGEEVFAAFCDNPFTHLPEHATVAASPEARANPKVMAALSAHVRMHLDEWRKADLDALAVWKIPPAPSMAPMPVPPGADMTQPPAPGEPSLTKPSPAPLPGLAGAPGLGIEAPALPSMPKDLLRGGRAEVPPGGPMPGMV
jgi:hypothetical protein